MVMAPGREESRPAPPRVLRLKQVTPERIPVERDNAPPLLAWVVRGERYPVDIAGELEDARDDYAATQERIWEDQPPPDLLDAVRELVGLAEGGESLERITEQIGTLKDALRTYDETPRYRTRQVDWEHHLTRVLCILVPGLDEEQVRMMPRADRVGWLWELGYFDQQRAEANPPDVGPSSSIGAELGPDSPGSTE